MMSERDSPLLEPLPVPRRLHLDKVCDRFEAACRAARMPRIEDYLCHATDAERGTLLRDLLVLDLHWRRSHGQRPEPQDYIRQFPDSVALVAAAFDEATDQYPLSADPGPARQSGRDGTGCNLLFGILALQNNFISRDDLLSAFATWTVDKSSSIGKILLGRGALSPELHATTANLVQAHLRINGG